MTVMKSEVSTASEEYRRNREAYEARIADLHARRAAAAIGGPERARQLHKERKQLLPREWFARAERHSWFARRVRQQSISQLQVGLTAPLPVLQVAVPLAPLLGLLGTVTGMLEVFDALSEHAGNDVRAMAYGISHAMISTLAGLVVSLVALFFYMQVRTRVRREGSSGNLIRSGVIHITATTRR